ncbi:MAG: MmgE/PrpD family protein [Pseudomonadota bacterium]|nr:MmgE/PrpD family protein [Pseudomonadota bacterium]
MGTTLQFCGRLAAVGEADLTEQVRVLARRLVLDGIAIAVAGASQRPLRLLAGYYSDQGGLPAASAIGFGFKLPPAAAAALNGAAMHVLDFEPMWSPANHALSTTLPAALAVAEQRGATGLALLTALVKGCEAQGWLREASGQYEPRSLVFHPPGVVGPIGGAVAAGHLLGLDPARLSHAVGMAASRSGTLLANVGTMTKSLHCGNAAAAGLEAALLAERGFTANPNVLEATQGLAAGFFAATFRPQELLRVGPPFRVEQPGFAIKMFPSQYGTHFAIDAALQLHGRVGRPETVRRATLTAPVMPYIDRPLPSSGLEGKFSLQYTAAAGLLDGAVRISTFTDKRVAPPDMRRFLPKMQLVMSADIPAHFDAMHVTLEVETEDGTVRRSRSDGPPGHWSRPPISDAEHLAKVRDCLAVGMETEAAEECIALAQRLDRLDEAGVRRLAAIAGAANRPCRGDAAPTSSGRAPRR